MSDGLLRPSTSYSRDSPEVADDRDGDAGRFTRGQGVVLGLAICMSFLQLFSSRLRAHDYNIVLFLFVFLSTLRVAIPRITPYIRHVVRPAAPVPALVLERTSEELRNRVLRWMRGVESLDTAETLGHPYSYYPQMAGEEDYCRSSLSLHQHSRSVSLHDSSTFVQTDEDNAVKLPEPEPPKLEPPPPAYFPPHVVARDSSALSLP